MIIIPTLILLALFICYHVKNRFKFGPISLLIITYLTMGVASLVCELFPVLYINSPIRLEPMSFLSICFIIIFLGFWNFTDSKFTAIRIENVVLYLWLENFLIVGGILTICFFLPFALSGLRGDILNNRTDIVLNLPSMARFGMINSIFSLIANMFILAQVCCFMNLIPIDGKRKLRRAILLLISSLSYFVYVLAYVGRDGTIYWTMSFLFCYLMFRNFLTKADLRKVRKIFALVLIFIFIPFIMISVSRFTNSPAGTALSLVSYGGQQIRNFNDHYQVNAPLQKGRFSFPVIVDFLESVKLKESSTFDKDALFSYFTDDDTIPWVFTTFIGTFMLDFGKTGVLTMLIFLALCAMGTTRNLKITGVFDFSNMVLFVLLYQIVHWGVFYFRFYPANFYLIGMVIVFATFKWFGISKSWAGPKRILKMPKKLLPLTSRSDNLLFSKEPNLGVNPLHNNPGSDK